MVQRFGALPIIVIMSKSDSSQIKIVHILILLQIYPRCNYSAKNNLVRGESGE